MKKIFLTSGIVVCLACPAFAEGEAFINSQGGTTVDGACDQPTLGVYDGPTKLEAIWTNNWHSITLNANTEANGAKSTEAEQDFSPIYYGLPEEASAQTKNIYTAEDITSNDNVFTAVTSDMKIPSAVSGTSAGKTVTLSFADGSHSNTVSPSGIPSQSSSAARPFAGYYASADGTGNPMVTAAGVPTAEGKAAAAGLSANTKWYAKYDCATIELPANPTLQGYTFAGWTDGTTVYSTDTASVCINENTTLTATWTAKTIGTITWDGQGATVDTTNATTSCSYGTNVTLPANPSKKGYTFGGWRVNNPAPSQGEQ